MCSAFNTAENPFQVGAEIVAEETRLIRRTDHAPVIRSKGEVTEMRWGFERSGLGSINNSRSDKLSGMMWQEAFRERRCLIPLAFYDEWSGPKGNKQAHRFRAAAGGWLWAAGIWERSATFGNCFSMITTEANEQAIGIHHRMPALLTVNEQASYLEGEMKEFSPKSGLLMIEDTFNPLKERPEFKQGELW